MGGGPSHHPLLSLALGFKAHARQPVADSANHFDRRRGGKQRHHAKEGSGKGSQEGRSPPTKLLPGGGSSASACTALLDPGPNPDREWGADGPLLAGFSEGAVISASPQLSLKRLGVLHCPLPEPPPTFAKQGQVTPHTGQLSLSPSLPLPTALLVLQEAAGRTPGCPAALGLGSGVGCCL